jgi:hypothetical protein
MASIAGLGRSGVALMQSKRCEGGGYRVGFLAQLHFYLDDIFPKAHGRPVFSGKG